jgi:hypothetical protein
LTQRDSGALTWGSASDFRGPAAALPQLIAHAWRLAYQRPASPTEIDLGCRFVLRQAARQRAASVADAERAALTNLCQQLLASNEFLHVD